jgi:hypothetical protein
LLSDVLLSTSVVVSFVILWYVESGILERTVEKNATETLKMLTVAFGEQAMGKTQVVSSFSCSEVV